jgi:LuxR family transcriptional regulator, maltose regulon positive regulatory protein
LDELDSNAEVAGIGQLDLPPHAPAPEAPAWILRRHRLHDRLTAGVEGPLTLVAAGAGSGKTVLLSSWLHDRRSGMPTAWVAVDARRAARPQFWSDALEALRATDAVGHGELADLAGPPSEAESDFAAHLVAALSELSGPLVLVIDDLHELASEALADLDYVIAHGAARLRVVAAARRDPDLSIHRLRLDGGLTEIRPDELAFTPAEAAELFAALGQPLTPVLADRLWRRTEGWAAGLRIAALSARGVQDMGAFVDAFAGDDRALADYLIAEVLARQPPRMRQFLLRTSIVDRLGPDLADVLSGGDDGARLLAELERANAFISRVPDRERPFRYHQLVAELLRGELRREAPEDLPALHGRASRWHAEAGLWLPAIEHALLAHDWPRAAALLGDHWMTLYLEGAGQSVQALLDRIPREHLVTDPQLAVTAAAARLLGGDAPAAAPYLALAEETQVELDGSERRRFEVSLAVARLLYARLTGQLQRAIEEARAVLQPRDGRPWEHELASDDKLVVALLNVGIAELWAGGRHASDVSLRRALHVARRRGHEYIAMQALGSLAGLTVMEGRLAESERLAGEAVDLAERRGWSTSPAVATALLALIGSAYLRDRLDDATRLLDRAEASMRTTREPVLLLTLDYVHALVLVGRGDHEGAITRCREARASVAELHDEHFLARPNLWLEARQLIIVGREDEARELLSTAGDASDSTEVRSPTALLLHRAGDSDRALEVLAPVLEGTASYNHLHQVLDAHLIAAEIHDDLGDVAASMRCTEAALELAEPEGYLRPFLDKGDPHLPDRLRRQVRHGTAHRALIDDILDRSDGRAPTRAEALTEPLSARELEVLRYLPTALQIAEISAELFVSVNTVRTHVKSIYRKLDVQRRSQAVERARVLRLLGPSARGG